MLMTTCCFHSRLIISFMKKMQINKVDWVLFVEEPPCAKRPLSATDILQRWTNRDRLNHQVYLSSKLLFYGPLTVLKAFPSHLSYGGKYIVLNAYLKADQIRKWTRFKRETLDVGIFPG